MKAALAIALVALLLHLPLVTAGPMADDYVQRLALQGTPGMGRMGPWSLFDFGSRADFAGPGHSLLPWFTGDDWRVRFLRPLASLELTAQHRLLGPSEVARHLVGLAALAAVLAAAWRMYRGLGLSPRAACIALAVLGCSDAAVLPVGWAANRSSAWCLLATLLAVDAAGRRAPLAAVLLACTAALFKESGLLAFALVVLRLHGWGTAGSAHPRRWPWTAAITLLVAAYLVAYVTAGYGTQSAMYASPWSDPLRFARHLLVLLTAGVASLAGPFPVDFAGLDPAASGAVALAGVLVSAALWRALAGDLGRHTATPFLLAATLLALVPQAGAAPSDRLLWPATAGAAGLLGIALERRMTRWRGSAPGARLVTASLFGCALALSALATLGQGFLHRHIAATTRALVIDSPLGTGPRDVLLLQASNGFHAFVAPPMHAYFHGESARFQSLQIGRSALRLTRTGPASAELEAPAGLLAGPFERLFRTPHDGLERGALRQAGRLRFEILETDGRGPTRIGLRADRDLDAPDLVLAVERAGRLVAIAAPPIGETLDLHAPPAALPFVP